MRLLLVGIVVFGAGCKTPGSVCGTDPGSTARGSTWPDPAVVLDRWDGPTFSELADLEVDDDDRVWFCTGVRGLMVYDASDPAELVSLDRIAPSAGSQVYPRCQHLAVADDGRVYVTNRGDAISPVPFVAVIDGSDPADLAEYGTLRPEYTPEGVDVTAGHLFVAAHEDGVVVYERGDREELTEVARLTDDVTNAWQVRVAGDHAYVADGTSGLRVVDVADPTAPSVLGSLFLGGVAKDLDLVGDRAYVALSDLGVAVVDVSDPTAPALLDREDTPGTALGVAAGEAGVFVADWTDVRLFDATDPGGDLRFVGREPVQIASGADSRVLGVAASGDVFFAGNWTELVSHRFTPGVDAPDLVVSPRHLSLPPDEPVELTLTNIGGEPLTVEGADSDPAALTVEDECPDDSDAMTLAPGESATVTATWSPASATATLDGWLAIRSDDPDQPRLCVPASGGGSRIGVGEGAPDDLSWPTLSGGTASVDGVTLLAYFATW